MPARNHHDNYLQSVKGILATNHHFLNGADVLSFDGVDDYVEVADDDSLNVGNFLTISAWVKVPSISERYGVYSGSVDDDDWWFEVGAQGEGFGAAVPGFWVARADNTISANTWMHLVYTRNGTGSGTHSLYRDGVKQTLDRDRADNFSNVGKNKILGGRTTSSQLFNGSIDSVQIYNRSLSQTEIENLYQLGRL